MTSAEVDPPPALVDEDIPGRRFLHSSTQWAKSSCIFKSIGEFIPKDEVEAIPRRVRGIYVLFDKVKGNKYKVAYVGKSDVSVKGRIIDHARSRRMGKKWDCCSIFKVHDNISHEEIKELESFILFIFGKDPRTIGLNTQKSTRAFRMIRKLPLEG